MQILIADDDPVSQTLIAHTLMQAGYSVIQCEDGEKALHVLQSPGGPTLGILDVMMPGLDGIQVCRALREHKNSRPFYLILLTSKGDQEDIVRGLEGGADDYIVKPFDLKELRARIRVGVRVLNLQSRLTERLQALESALNQVTQLQGLLPICSYCKKIRNDQNYWQQVEEYVSSHADVQFSHGICPNCFEKELVPQFRRCSEPAKPAPSQS